MPLQAPVVVVTPDTGTLGVASAASDDPYSLRLRNVTWDGSIGVDHQWGEVLLGYTGLYVNILYVSLTVYVYSRMANNIM